MFKIALSAIAVAMVATATLSAQTSITVSSEDKGVKVEAITRVSTCDVTPNQNIQPAPSSADYSDTIVYAKPVKKSYHPYESIKVRLKLKRDAYIYFWTVSSDGKGYLILPNNFESYHKYKKDIDYVVPERSADYEFVSDREGVERIFVLATNKQISNKKLKSIFETKKKGAMPVASNKAIKSFVTKDIQVIARRKNLKYDIEAFNIKVKN